MRLVIYPKFIAKANGKSVALSEAQGLIVLSVLAHGAICKDHVLDIFWPDPDRMPDDWESAFRARLTYLRYKLREIGYTLSCKEDSGFGIYLSGWRIVPDGAPVWRNPIAEVGQRYERAA